MNKTICFCNSNIAWGGGEKWHLDAALALAARGWRVLLICHPQGALCARVPKDAPGLEIVPIALGRLSFLNPLKRKRLTALFRAVEPRAVILNLPADLKAAGMAARAAGVPQVIFRRGLAKPVADSTLNRHLYKDVMTRLIVNSEATLKMVLANNSTLIPRDRITVLSNGIDAQAFDQALAECAAHVAPQAADAEVMATLRALAAARLAGGKRPLVLGNAGRLNVQKGQHLLLDLGKRLSDAGVDFRLVIAGEGEREGELKFMAREQGLEDKVLFTGFIPDLSCFWQAIDIFVLTSLWEGFGYVLLEAMLAEKPIVAFRVSNIPELITDDVNGYLFPLPEGEQRLEPALAPGLEPDESDAEKGAAMTAMAATVQTLALDAALRQRLGSAGRAFALEGFSQDACMDRVEAIL